jgi:hypothetical protein
MVSRSFLLISNCGVFQLTSIVNGYEMQCCACVHGLCLPFPGVATPLPSAAHSSLFAEYDPIPLSALEVQWIQFRSFVCIASFV